MLFEKKIFTDQLKREVEISFPPQKIISVVPSQTELLFHLGLDKQVIGITKFCIHPDNWYQNKNRVGGTKKLNISKIKSLKPDLIIANKEENTQEDIALLAKKIPVWVSDINNLSDALDMIQQIGQLTGKELESSSIITQIVNNFKQIIRSESNIKVAYYIWREPYMTVGGDTFIHNMIETMGWNNVYGCQSRYPEVTIDELKILKPDVILLSSEPYPFKEQHAKEIEQIYPTAQIELVNGEMFSWYGSRLLDAPQYFQTLCQKFNKLPF